MSAVDAANRFDIAVSKDQVYQSEHWAGELEKLAGKNPEAKAQFEARRTQVEKVRKDVRELNDLLTEIKTNDGWQLATEIKKKELTVYFKMPEGSPFILTKATKIIRPIPGKPLTHTFVSLASLFAETDLMPKYFPMGLMQSHETLLEESAFSRFTRIRISVPVPLVASREAIIHGKGYDITERSAMAISFKSLPDDFEHPGFKMPAASNKYCRIDISGAYYLEIQPDGSVIFSQLQLMDLKFKFVPSFILNMLSKGQMPVEFNDNLLKKLHTWEGSEWHKRTLAKPGLYEDLRGRLEDYLSKSGVNVDGAPKSGAYPQAPEEDARVEEEEKPAEPPSALETMLVSMLSYLMAEDKAKEYAGQAGAMVKKLTGEVPAENPAEAAPVPANKRESKRQSKRLSLRQSLKKAAPPAQQPHPVAEPTKMLLKQPSRMSKLRGSIRFGKKKSAAKPSRAQLAASPIH